MPLLQHMGAYLGHGEHDSPALDGRSIGGGQQDATQEHEGGGQNGAPLAADLVSDEAHQKHAQNDTGHLCSRSTHQFVSTDKSPDRHDQAGTTNQHPMTLANKRVIGQRPLKMQGKPSRNTFAALFPKGLRT